MVVSYTLWYVEIKAIGRTESRGKKRRGEREKKTDRQRQSVTGAGRWSRLRWMEKKTAAERQDNFSHFSVGGQTDRESLKRWSVTE